MAEITAKRQVRHSGRFEQIPIYLGKQLRSFVYLNDWKVLPMAAIIGALVSMVVRGSLFKTMEGTLTGGFALVCVGIWNGCFNSIQVICRERDILKREHRSGLHISSYIIAHMIYQALLCLAQTGITIYVCKMTGVAFPKEGFMTPNMMIDIGISLFLITYASDMLSLLISALSKTTTAAMTVMPFLLIFQLVFSGGFFALPEWAKSLAKTTVSRYGLTAIVSQGNYNELPMATGYNTLAKMNNEEITATIQLGQVMDLLQQDDKQVIHELRNKEIDEGALLAVVGIPALPEESGSSETVNVGEIIDVIANAPGIVENREQTYEAKFTIGELINLFGEARVREVIEGKTAAASQKAEYVRTKENIVSAWNTLALFALLYAALATIFLEFIDYDKR